MPEFTGERLVPELVHADLLNEHMARYVFAKPLAAGKRVLDAGCGLGYGTAELGTVASSIAGIDVSPEAVTEARARYPQFTFVEGSCEALPFSAGEYDLIVAFEVIEHLRDWRAFLGECARVLAPGGHLLVSTPNRDYYAESRKHAGPNPFHVHEFNHTEFEQELRAFFPVLTMLLQNHAEGVAIVPQLSQRDGLLSVAAQETDISRANFFLAVCSLQPFTEPSAFFYLPHAGNVLRERERHISLLENELALKNATLTQRNEEHRWLVENFRALQAELEERNQWAADRHRESVERGERISALQTELRAGQQAAAQSIAQLEHDLHAGNTWARTLQEKVDALGQVHVALQQEHARLAAWHRESEARHNAFEKQLSEQLNDAVEDLQRCNKLLNTAEETVVERTLWAQDLSAEVDDLSAKVNDLSARVIDLSAMVAAAAASRWVRLGRKVGVGPQL